CTGVYSYAMDYW
nr:immunoglobulin heavy chain junction region [Mus musculus]